MRYEMQNVPVFFSKVRVRHFMSKINGGIRFLNSTYGMISR